ncbi:MAG TPA: hypothetical protein VJA85_09260 [Candidatus Limnocylindria bacterium]|nr:hypothetical protein [Candidatus Limnocylindria bacterium]
MGGFGALLILFGLGSLVLPLVGFQFSLMGWVDPYQPWAGIGVALAGVSLLLLVPSRRVAATVPPGSVPAGSLPPGTDPPGSPPPSG